MSLKWTAALESASRSVIGTDRAAPERRQPALPGSMNLSNATASRAALVSVASVEKPGVQRVAPSNSAASYVVQKLQGDPGISGNRMPFGGPFLDQATINVIRQWIDAGAP